MSPIGHKPIEDLREKYWAGHTARFPDAADGEDAARRGAGTQLASASAMCGYTALLNTRPLWVPVTLMFVAPSITQASGVTT